MQSMLGRWRNIRPIQISWVGDGPLLYEMRQAVLSRGLVASVTFAGHEAERMRVLELLREAYVFVFCHLTPESPRYLIEALMSGVPILGFESVYARDLVAGNGLAANLVPLGDTDGLADVINDSLENSGKCKSDVD